MRYILALMVGLASLWLLLSGHYTPLILSLGALSCALVTAVCLRMRLVDAESIPLHMLARLPGYAVWLALEIAKSNWDVIKRIMSPRRAISPTMITLHNHERSELGQVILANSITLTPGTVTVALRGGVAEVHALAAEAADGMEGGEMDQRVHALEAGRETPSATNSP